MPSLFSSSFVSACIVLSALRLCASALPSISKRYEAPKTCGSIYGPALQKFPDPSLTYIDNVWYSFSTGPGKDSWHINGSSSTDFKTWTPFEKDPLPDLSNIPWTKGPPYSVWAPDVMRRREDKKFLMYFAALDTTKTNGQHCVGIAESNDIKGPYTPRKDAFVCDAQYGGSIDPAWFRDSDDSNGNLGAYVVYKRDAGHIGGKTQLMLQEVDKDGANEGIAPVKDSKGNLKLTTLLTSLDEDGSYGIEAPYLIKRGKTYFLFFSTHLFYDGTYDIRYATSKTVTGPYSRKDANGVEYPALANSKSFMECKEGSAKNYLFGPGGASFQRFGDNKMVFASVLEPDTSQHIRGMWTGEYDVHEDDFGGTISWKST